MVFLENLKSELEALRHIISELHDVYDIERSQERIAELKKKTAKNFKVPSHSELWQEYLARKVETSNVS